MDGWTVAIIVFDIVALAVFLKLRRSSRQLPEPAAPPRRVDDGRARAHLAAAADILGLDFRVHGVAASLAGERQACAVQVEPLGILHRPEARDVYDLKVTLHNRARLNGELMLTPRRPGPRRGASKSFRLGDPVFEQTYELSGREAEVRARLTVANRGTVLALPGLTAVVGDRLTYSARGLFESPEAIVAAVEEAMHVLEALADPPDLDPPLAKVALGDPEAQVRAGAMEALAKTAADAQLLEETARAAAKDPFSEVRLGAARALGAEAKDILQELALGNHPMAVRKGAIELSMVNLSAQDCLHIVSELMGGPGASDGLLAATTALLAEHRVEGGVELLLGHLDPGRPKLALDVVHALGEYEDPRAEGALLALLEAPAEALRTAAAGALGALGTPEALEPLGHARHTERAPEVKARMQWAIGAIRARGQVEAGRLSIAATDAGALAFTDAGALSVRGEEE